MSGFRGWRGLMEAGFLPRRTGLPRRKALLSAIIVTYRTSAALAAAVRSLNAQTLPPDEVIVVDNGAANGEPAPPEGELEGARIERPMTNLGYGVGCNLGIRAASGDQLLVLNADVVLAANAISAMVNHMERDNRIAVVGPRIFSGGEVQLSARAFPSLRTGFLGRRSVLTQWLIRARRYPAEFKDPRGRGGAVDWVSGACMLIRRSALEAIGGFDEDYWMYWEDADLCRRLVNERWQVHFEPGAIVHHATAASGTNERTIAAFHESAARFAAKHIAHTRLARVLIARLLRARSWLVLRRFHASRRSR